VPERNVDPAVGFDVERYWSKRLDEQYSLAGVGWLGLSERFNRWMYAVRRRAFRRAVGALPDPPAARVLDVGSGTGFYVGLWAKIGVRDITGCDITRVAVERLRERFPVSRFEQLDIWAPAPALEGPYEAISAMDMLFHIVDDDRYQQALRNLANLLAPEGILVLTENLPHGGTLRAEHQVSRSFDEVVNALNDVGLEITSRRPLFVLMNTPVDSDSAFLRHFFPVVHLLARTKVTGWLLGAALYPFELALTRFLREGPTTEILVCRLGVNGAR
jgi:SAM-dependent methyltransferase